MTGPIGGGRDIREYIGRFAKRSGRVYHNCYASLPPDGEPAAKGRSGVVILEKELDFHRVLFATGDLDEFPALLAEATENRDVCLNCLCTGSVPEALHRAIAGVLPYSLRHERMFKTGFNPGAAKGSHAEESDAGRIFDLLRANFNKYDSFLPSYDAVLSRIREKNVLTIKNGDAVSAFLMFTCQGRTAHSNFLLSLGNVVDDAVLLRQASYNEFAARNIRIAYSWVNPDANARLLKAYLLSGHCREGRFNYFYRSKNNDQQ